MASSSTSRLYTADSTDPNSLPPKEDGWTRFVCISDTHSKKYSYIPPGDVLLHAGDLSSQGYPHRLQKTLDWLGELPQPVKCIIAGNHDLCLDPDIDPADQEYFEDRDGISLEKVRERIRSEEVTSKGIRYLEHEPLVITSPTGRRWKVYGSPAAARYSIGAFQYETKTEAEVLYSRIPADTEILLTHTPPYRIHDKTRHGIHAGCPVLARRLPELQQCRLHVFGHIHESCGASIDEKGMVSVNAALARMHGRVTVVDLKD
ncbi:Metallo-dependent phosphatase [Schizophyllum commune Tattone D]|nr:Metallo-dependent phosphatase [Schizophyllum commune Tattone D]